MIVKGIQRNRFPVSVGSPEEGLFVRTGAFLEHPDSQLVIPHRTRAVLGRLSSQLYFMFRVVNGKFVMVTPYSDANIAQCELQPEERLVVKMDHILAFSDSCFFARERRLFDLNSFLIQQFCFTYFEGPATVFLFGLGSLDDRHLVEENADYDPNTVIAWTNSLGVGVSSRSSPMSALFSKEEICLTRFSGTGQVLLQSSNVPRLSRQFNSSGSQTSLVDYINTFLGLRI